MVNKFDSNGNSLNSSIKEINEDFKMIKNGFSKK